MNQTLAVVTPVYNDWTSFSQLVVQLDAVLAGLGCSARIFAVDDKSTDLNIPTQFPELRAIKSIEIVHLIRNVGHQRAIAVGLASLCDRSDIEAVIVMDADGEDRPQDVGPLFSMFRENPDKIIVVVRSKRSEGLLFRAFYLLYKQLFHLLAGVTIDFGNFCLIPWRWMDDLTYNPNLWNHFAATIQSSRIPLTRTSAPRGVRYDGQSSMSFMSLVLHGLSALSVYLDTIVVRTLMLIGFVTFISTLGIAVVVGIRLFTDLAIPGWATSTVGLLVIIALQMFFFGILVGFLRLSMRSWTLITPALDVLQLVKKRDICYESNSDHV
jgi:polyisoprenyl-phosphate glycosyltransferase